jgi:hypothetical protein
MYARAVDDAATRLRELRVERRDELGVAGLALVLAVVAAEIRPALAVPLLAGGLAVGALGIRSLWRRWELLERLAAERDAYEISEVRAYASSHATPARRRSCAGLIRNWLQRPGLVYEARVAVAADELEALAADLDDASLALDPACAVACVRLLTDVEGSPLLNQALPPEELRCRVRQIRSGFGPHLARAPFELPE